MFPAAIKRRITDTETTDGRFGLTRRRLLAAAGGLVGLGGLGALYVRSELSGDFGPYTAPDGFPAISTRGRVDPAVDDPESLPSSESGSASADDQGSAVVDKRTAAVVDKRTAAVVDGSLAEKGDALLLFVHGFGTDDATARDQAFAAATGLESIRPLPVVAYSWDADREWEPAKAMADANGPVLADWLIEWADTDGRPVHVVGYSLGARVVCRALFALALAGRGDAAASVSLLGGAIPHDSVARDTPYGEAIDELDVPVTNFHNADDRVLGWTYRLSDRTQAVGETGIADPESAPAGYTDVDVTEAVPDHYSYFEPDEGCLPQLAARLPR
ncbi:DUF726 domain-containing protein [Halohasta salina]|uniref:DUF726 domain-containing protein n=1 Tax=Halohasta salina TaxID=2961621 RepID=UPI0020A266CC|nr:DUF726 domain-containing protein [Halohasta salina]